MFKVGQQVKIIGSGTKKDGKGDIHHGFPVGDVVEILGRLDSVNYGVYYQTRQINADSEYNNQYISHYDLAPLEKTNDSFAFLLKKI